MAGINYQDLDRVGGDGHVHELSGGQVEGHLSVTVKGRAARFGISPGWSACNADELARIPGPRRSGWHGCMCGPLLSGRWASVCRFDSGPECARQGSAMAAAARSRAVAAEGRAAERPSRPGTRHQGSLRRRCRLPVASRWHDGGSRARPARPSGRRYPLMRTVVPTHGRHAQAPLLVAPPERIQEGYEVLCTVICSWQWDEGQA